MNVRKFSYRKKKDEQEKTYIVLLLDPPDNKPDLIGGFDLTKLNDAEIAEIIKLVNEYETDIHILQTDALKRKMSFDEMVNGPDYLKTSEYYKEKTRPFIKKAYRLYIRDRITNNYDLDDIDHFVEKIIREKNSL